jgi:hypothetical protein
MSCIHDNETILAKKAKLVKMQKYVKKKTTKNSHHYAVLYIVIVII